MGSAVQVVSDAFKLIRDHPDFWACIERQAAEDYRSGEYMSIKRYVENARNLCKVAPSDSQYGISNTFTPAFARILLMRHPEYSSLKFRPSKVDEVFSDPEKLSTFAKATFKNE